MTIQGGKHYMMVTSYNYIINNFIKIRMISSNDKKKIKKIKIKLKPPRILTYKLLYKRNYK